MLNMISFTFGPLKKALTILLFSFYLSGAVLLPMGDFSVIKDLPDMYRHCRDTEDPDLTVFEFFTEHVSAIGQLIEGVTHEDEKDGGDDKPHAPVQYQFQQQVSCIVYQIKTTVQKPIVKLTKEFSISFDQVYVSSYISSIFRPPMV